MVYEVKTKTFYHYDTLRGANWEYIQLLAETLLTSLHQTNQFELIDYLVPCHDIQQGNSWDCGVAVISIRYQGNLKNIKLGKFNFGKDREELRTNYLRT